MQLRWNVACSRGTGPSVIDGVNTLQFSVSNLPAPDILAIAATLQNDGVMHMPGNGVGGTAGVAAVNIGVAGELLVRPRATSAPSLLVNICPTDAMTGACLEPASSELSVPFAAESIMTFSIFATTTEVLALDPASRRVFIEFFDSSGSLRGATSVAVEGRP